MIHFEEYDVLESLVYYTSMSVTCDLCILSWFGNELSTQVREFIMFSTRYNDFVIVLKVQYTLDLITATKLFLDHKFRTTLLP